MTAIVHTSRCDFCQFASRKKDHPNKAHSWMGDEDREAAKVPHPTTPEERAALAESHPCNCWCNGRQPVVVI